ncbi:MAG TPA: isochorismatase family cysteine hydrolase [Chondromyces sp.]|nr:isochorismatase family cysteine hydrolase [Chondromyces sp.]
MTKKTERKALLIIDVINSFQFDQGKILAEKTKEICPQILKMKEFCKENDFPIIYINDHYYLWKADIDKIINHCMNDISAPIIQQLKPKEDDYFLIKPKHSAFYGTALNTLLHQLDVDSLIITGIAGNICVLFTANDAYMREYDLYIPEDGMTSVREQDDAYTLEMMKNVLNADTRPIDEYIKNNPS